MLLVLPEDQVIGQQQNSTNIQFIYIQGVLFPRPTAYNSQPEAAFSDILCLDFFFVFFSHLCIGKGNHNCQFIRDVLIFLYFCFVVTFKISSNHLVIRINIRQQTWRE